MAVSSVAVIDPGTEFEMSDRDFQSIARLVKQETGIVLGPQKRNLVYGRLAKRLRMNRLSDFGSYLELLQGPDSATEFREMLNAITTNLTAFFREAHHFEMLEQEILPALMRKRCQSGDRLRLWSSACSSGEEAYSMAMSVAAVLPQFPDCDVKILATDIDTQMVRTASAGIYDEKRIETVPPRFRSRFLKPTDDGQYRVTDELKSLVAFKELNLFDRWPMKGPFDVIVCRNVMIYFDKPSQDQLFDRFADYMSKDAWLLIGHSETVPAANQRLVRSGKTAYRRAP
jgi:chemotaxis protein methyltransferase CheR